MNNEQRSENLETSLSPPLFFEDSIRRKRLGVAARRDSVTRVMDRKPPASRQQQRFTPDPFVADELDVRDSHGSASAALEDPADSLSPLPRLGRQRTDDLGPGGRYSRALANQGDTVLELPAGNDSTNSFSAEALLDESSASNNDSASSSILGRFAKRFGRNNTNLSSSSFTNTTGSTPYQSTGDYDSFTASVTSYGSPFGSVMTTGGATGAAGTGGSLHVRPPSGVRPRSPPNSQPFYGAEYPGSAASYSVNDSSGTLLGASSVFEANPPYNPVSIHTSKETRPDGAPAASMPSSLETPTSLQTATSGGASAARHNRSFQVGDRVLICNHQSRWVNLVNRFGFPDGQGRTPEEQRGPYVYVLATVKAVHFGEDARYYTVTRADNPKDDQRADAEWMEPILSREGEEAARKAATEGTNAPFGPGSGAKGPGRPGRRQKGFNFNSDNGEKEKRCSTLFRRLFIDPIVCIVVSFDRSIFQRTRNGARVAFHLLRKHARLLLDGMKPYSCAVRITGVNLLVLCSTWYVFIDQIRLAFLSPSADHAVAYVSTVVWAILVLELVFETFIRPFEYTQYLQTEKAFAPTTVRHIDRFHIVIESLSLVFFIPEIVCLFSPNWTCSDSVRFSAFRASLTSIIGPQRLKTFCGRVLLAFVRLRIFGLVRHWKQMWINNTVIDPSWNNNRKRLVSGVFMPASSRGSTRVAPNVQLDKTDGTGVLKAEIGGDPPLVNGKQVLPDHDEYLINATNIGTALTVINSHRSLLVLGAIVALLPVIQTLALNGGANTTSTSMVGQLLQTNLIANNPSSDSCQFLEMSTRRWMLGATMTRRNFVDEVYILWVQILPVRCPFQGSDGVVTSAFCNRSNFTPAFLHDLGVESAHIESIEQNCHVWGNATSATSVDELARRANVRSGVTYVHSESEMASFADVNGALSNELFNVTAVYSENQSVRLANFASFLLQAMLLLFVLLFLSVLRTDAGRLVLGPLRRMLKIVSLYAKNPLAPAAQSRNGTKSGNDGDEESEGGDDDIDPIAAKSSAREDELGNFETEQLISAVAKITDLLRKCWGVAGAGIISSNLARQDDGLTAVFNPCVPGKCVYALFAFAAIKGFDHQLRALGAEIMILINDVAAVLHGEAYRWGFGDSGQCNKNLGSAFLMVYRIGDVQEVKEKLDKATNVIFSDSAPEKRRIKTQPRRRKGTTKSGSDHSSRHSVESATTNSSRIRARKRMQNSGARVHADSLSLAQLPGINTFTDRALVGMLKTFAGIYRDTKLLDWKKDFRLGAGVGVFSVDMIFGMDAGWAVEGAVGSEHKIDATYLSPHVNMASRMMSACKQYGLNILLSQAVEELLSEPARKKLRHVDTVTVKGSSVKQKIFTYDARHKGVDFFLFERDEDQADLDAQGYNANIWENDQDLTAMRQHVTDEFLEVFNKGRREYLAGNWQAAIEKLKRADQIMVETVMDLGYIDDEIDMLNFRILDGEDVEREEENVRNEMGDGPSRRLIAHMESEGGHAPKNWKGYRPLTSK